MKGFAFLAVALTMVPAAAFAQTVEEGFPRGSLAVAAIDQGDWNRAEALLRTSSLDNRDPARLINLGAVYMRTGRSGEALAAWREALASNRHSEVETLGGRFISTRDLAREAIARYETAAVSR